MKLGFIFQVVISCIYFTGHVNQRTYDLKLILKQLNLIIQSYKHYLIEISCMYLQEANA